MRARDRPHVGVAVDAQHPGDVGRDLPLELGERGRDLVDLAPPFRPQHRLAGVEQHFRLQHEAVAHFLDVGTIAEDQAQAAEEIRAVALQLLHLLGERDVEALAEVGNLRLGFLVLLLADVERRFERRQLILWTGAPERGFTSAPEITKPFFR